MVPVAQAYDVVADIERYPEFLPGCHGVTVLSRHQDEDHVDGVEAKVAAAKEFKAYCKLGGDGATFPPGLAQSIARLAAAPALVDVLAMDAGEVDRATFDRTALLLARLHRARAALRVVERTRRAERSFGARRALRAAAEPRGIPSRSNTSDTTKAPITARKPGT